MAVVSADGSRSRGIFEAIAVRKKEEKTPEMQAHNRARQAQKQMMIWAKAKMERKALQEDKGDG